MSTLIIPTYNRKIELVELCSIFLGDRWAKAYLACVLANLYGTLWVFSTVFGKTLSTYMVYVGVMDSFSQYIISLLLLFVIVIPGSLLDFKDQVRSLIVVYDGVDAIVG